MNAGIESLLSLVPREAHALRLVRGLPTGELRTYSATTFPNDPYKGCERTVRMALAVGWIEEKGRGDDYGVLDMIDEEWDIVADFAVPTAKGFQALKKRLGMVVEHDE